MSNCLRYFMCAVLVAGACTSGNKEAEPNIDYQYELIKMEELGGVDSTVMMAALKSDNDIVKAAAAKTCGIVRDGRFSSTLGHLCINRDKMIREAAIFALGEIADTSSLQALAEVLYSEDKDDRLLAIEAFGKIGDQITAPFIRPFLRKSEEEAYEAALAVYRMADTLSLADLRLLAAESSGRALYGSIYAMFRLFPDSCVPEFVNVFENRKIDDSLFADISAIAARGLGMSEDTAAVLMVFDKHFDKLPRSARIELVRALGNLRVGREELEEILYRSDDNGLKRVILQSLGQMGDSKSKKVIEKYLRDTSLQVRLAAITALPDIDKKSPTATLEKLKSSSVWQIRAAVARALGKVKSNRSLKQLRLMLEDKDDRVKAGVIEGLGEFPISRNIDIIKAALNGSDDTVVKSTAADVLGRSKNDRALEILAQTARKNFTTSDIDFARSLISALGNFIDTTETGLIASGLIKEFLNHPDRIVRQDAHGALGKLAPENFDPGLFNVEFTLKDFENIRELMNLGVVAVVTTPRGVIKIRLEPKIAPRTTFNFARLAERGFYDNLTFHRVVQDFVIQGGCPRADGWGGPEYTIREEINPIKFRRGTIGMATSGRDTGGSQFFICLSDQPHLDGRYTAFGSVIEGQEILDKIEIGDSIVSIRIEKGRLSNEY